jgi:hypothetical protein
MSIFAPPAVPAPSNSEYNDAVNASRFVKGFGLAALVYAVLLLAGINLLSAAVGIGTGLFIFRYDVGRFYKVLGAVVMVLALIVLVPFLGPGVLAGGVLWKGAHILGVLGRSPQDDPDWAATRSRTVTGMAAAAAGLVICAVIMVLILVWIASAVAGAARGGA